MKKTIIITLVLSILSLSLMSLIKASCSVSCATGSCNATGTTADCRCSKDGKPRCTWTGIVLSSDDKQKEFQLNFINFLNNVCKTEQEILYKNSQINNYKFINENDIENYNLEFEKSENLFNSLDKEMQNKITNWVSSNL